VVPQDLAPKARQPRPATPGWVHDLSITLARVPEIVRLSRALTEHQCRSDRLARIAALFAFVGHLVDDPMAGVNRYHDGIDELMRVVGRQRGPAVALAALLRASGERVVFDEVAGICFVQVQVDAADLDKLPPHAALVEKRGRLYLPLDPRRARSPLGFVPLWVRQRISWREC
jgi:hypothetical protein